MAYTLDGIPSDLLTTAPIGERSLKVDMINSIVPTSYDSIDLSYNIDGLVETVVYKENGATKATLTITYTAGNITNITRA